MSVQHGGEHSDAVRLDPHHRPSRCRQHGTGHQRLNLNGQAAMAVQRERHARALHTFVGGRQEQSRGIADLLDALATHIETPDLIRRPEPVLHRPQHTQRRFRIALELAYHIHQMLQRARAGDGPVLGDMPDQEHGDVQRLRRVDQRARHLAHLRGAAGDAINVLRDDGLRRIHDRQCRPRPLDQPQHGGEIGGGRQ